LNKGLYIATAEANSGKSMVIIGLLNAFLGKLPRVGYFKPIIDDQHEKGGDVHIETILSTYNLDLLYRDCFEFTKSEASHLISNGKESEVIDRIIYRYKALESACDFILVEGTDFEHEMSFFEMDINVTIAKNLSLPVLIVTSGQKKTKEELISLIEMTYFSYLERDALVVGVIANKIDQEDLDYFSRKNIPAISGKVGFFPIPYESKLSQPTIKEIIDHLDGKVLVGKELVNNQASNFTVGAMQLRNFLDNLKERNLVITPGDRADIILGSLQANQSSNYPSVSGIMLSGGLLPEPSVLKLIEGLDNQVPIVSVKDNTFEIANKIGDIKAKIRPDNELKIKNAQSIIGKYVDINAFTKEMLEIESRGMTPRMFQYNLVQRARKIKKHIVLPEGCDERILEAAGLLVQQDLVNITLLGEKSQIEDIVKKKNILIDLEKVQIIDPLHSVYYADFVDTFYQLRKHKNITMDVARDCMADVSYFGTMMIYKGMADGMVSGAMHTSQHTIRPALQFIKTKPGVSVVSSIFFMCLDDRVMVFGDCAINPNPTAEQLAEIAISSAESSLAFDVEPRIAMLSYSSGDSGKGADVDIVRKATQIVRAKRPDLKIEGPIQYDAAVDKGVAEKKLPNSEVAGQATVLIFPDLNTGNNTYKAVQRETGALAIGPMLQGLRKPVNDLSRGATVDDVYNTVILTAIQAQQGSILTEVLEMSEESISG
jgi:phosphate acetyltransferase